MQHVRAVEACDLLEHWVDEECLTRSDSSLALSAWCACPRGILHDGFHSCYGFARHDAQEELKNRLKEDHYHEQADVLQEGQGPSERKLVVLVIYCERCVHEVNDDEEYEQEEAVEGDQVVTP